ncbi:MAG: trigger factor [Candidatus Omnitrophica bacterium]|nr:trigger factor [Candidatus Omnitrophota bacterium]
MAKGANLTFKARVEVRPEINLQSYKGIAVKKKKSEITDDEAEATLKQLQGMYAQYQPITEARALQKGDFAVCDVEVFIDGKPITKKHEKMMIEVSKDASLLGMGEDLAGMKAGEEKAIRKELPADYPDKKFAGTMADFKVNVKEIKEKKIPALDDEFAKDLGANDLATLRGNLKAKLLERKDADAVTDMKNQILEKLLKAYAIHVPPSMARRQLDILMKHLEEDLMSRGIPKDSVEAKKKEFEPKLKEDAVNKVRIYFILDTIADKENIKLKESDVDERIQKIADTYKQDAKTVRQYYETNDLIDGLLEQIREEKTLEWLLANADIRTE